MYKCTYNEQKLITNNGLNFTMESTSWHVDTLSFIWNQICVFRNAPEVTRLLNILFRVCHFIFRCQENISILTHKKIWYVNARFMQLNKPPSSIQLKNQISQHVFQPKKRIKSGESSVNLLNPAKMCLVACIKYCVRSVFWFVESAP